MSLRAYLPEPKGKSSRVDAGRLLATLVMVCVALLGAWMGDRGGGYFVGDWAPTVLVLAALLLLVFLSGRPTIGGARWSLLALGLFAAYASWTLASLLWSPNAGAAWLGAGQTLLYLLAFWVALILAATGASRRWVLAASVLGPAVVAALTLRALIPRLEEMFDNDRLVGTVGYYNGEAAFLLVGFWVAIYLGGSRSVNPILRGLILGGAVLCLDLAVLTQSRGAMVAMAVSLPVYFLLSGQRLRGLLALLPVVVALYITFPGLNGVYLALSAGEAPVETLLGLVLPTVWLTAALTGLYGLCWGVVDRIWTPSPGLVRFAGAAIAVGCVAAGGAVFLAGTAAPAVRPSDTNEPVALVGQKWEAFKSNDSTGEDQSRYLSASGSGRYELWRVAWQDFEARPVLGVGTYNYEATYYQLRERGKGFVRQPHMLALEVLSERGIVGGGLFFGLLATCLTAGLWRRFGGLSPEGKAQVGALVAAVAYWFVHSSAEWFWQFPAVTLPAIIYLALLVSPWRKIEGEPDAGSRPGWVLRLGGVGAAVLAVAVVAPLYAADGYLERSRDVENPEEGLELVERAQRFNPLDAKLPEREAELAIETGEWDLVEDAYGRAIRLNPEHYEPHLFLATFYERRGQFEQALDHYKKARALNPLDEYIEGRVEGLQGKVPERG